MQNKLNISFKYLSYTVFHPFYNYSIKTGFLIRSAKIFVFFVFVNVQ